MVFAILAVAEYGAFFPAVDTLQSHLPFLVAAFQFCYFSIQIEEVFIALP